MSKAAVVSQKINDECTAEMARSRAIQDEGQFQKILEKTDRKLKGIMADVAFLVKL